MLRLWFSMRINIKGRHWSIFFAWMVKCSPSPGFAPDVKIWQVVFAKTGEFKSLSRAFELTGHSSGVYDFAFNADSSLVSTISKDGSWRLYNIKSELSIRTSILNGYVEIFHPIPNIKIECEQVHAKRLGDTERAERLAMDPKYGDVTDLCGDEMSHLT